MISKNVEVLIEKYCIGIRPTDEQLDEIMDAAIASSADPNEVGKYIEALQNCPTRAAVEAMRKAEADAKRKVEEEAKRKAEAEAKHKAEEEAKRKAEEEAKRRAEIKRKADAEAKRKAEEALLDKAWEEAERKAEAKRKVEEEVKRKAEEEAKRKAEEEKRRQENMAKAKELYDKGKAKTKGFFSANYKEARAFFEQSLALGYGDAAYEIANMYKIGIGGCEKNLQEYLKLIDRGIELHSSYVAEQAAKDFRVGSGVVPKDKMKSAIYEGIATGIRNKYK